MRRREFIILLGGAAAAWPLLGRAQQLRKPVVGFLHSQSYDQWRDMVVAFKSGLESEQILEGRDVEIEYRWAENHVERLPGLASELVRQNVAVIVSTGGDVTTQAAKTATDKIPIVFLVGTDPVKTGLVKSLSRPGANLTGLTLLTASLEAKRMELLRQVLPDVHSIAALINPNSPRAEDDAGNVRDAARSLGLSIRVIEANTIDTIDAALETAARERVGAVTVVADPLFIQHGPRITALATARSLPVIYPWRVQAEGGGLMSYGTSLGVAYEKLGVYAAKILKNIKPADLPVEQPTKFELIINLKTAKTLGLAIPPSVLARVDEVIE